MCVDLDSVIITMQQSGVFLHESVKITLQILGMGGKSQRLLWLKRP